MDILHRKDFEQLITSSGTTHVSLYMPTHRVGREMQQDPIRLKNLSTHAQDKLIEFGVRRPEVEDLMQPVESLLSDTNFWQHQGDGLAVFLSPGFVQPFRLPHRFDELMVIGRRFHIRSLLPMLDHDEQFHILAISLKKIRLFLGTRDTITEVDLSEIPTTMQEVLYMDDPEKHLDFHTGSNSSGKTGNRPAVYHGQGTQSDEDEKKNILRYFQYFNKELTKVIEDASLPTILAGVDYLLPIYREASAHPELLKEGIEGNPDGMSEKELHERAWKLMEPSFEADKKKAIQQLGRLEGKNNDLIAGDLEAIVKAAAHGAVDTFFVPLETMQWGRFLPEDNRVVMEKEPSLDNEDLFNLAAVQTISNSGRVFAVRQDEYSGRENPAAILRFPI
ncbi:MAG: hypothetical protein C3F07_15920 [Anaerolineales bacterium]|nr:MAG: hypothetical protein C3F07_15920 [Anaerolineales bacterium]